MLNHEPHETHERGVGAFGVCVGPPSDPRLRPACLPAGRRALGTLAQGCPSPEPALQASLRRRLKLGHGPTAQPNAASEVRQAASDGGPARTLRRRASRTPVGKQGSVEQACLQNRDLRSSPGRRMPDGWTRQRPRTAMLEWEQDYRCGVSPFVGFVWFVVTIRPLRTQAWCRDTPGMFLLHAVAAVERETTVHTPFGSRQGRSPRPGCGMCINVCPWTQGYLRRVNARS
jgi:hypothetical protein